MSTETEYGVRSVLRSPSTGSCSAVPVSRRHYSRFSSHASAFAASTSTVKLGSRRRLLPRWKGPPLEAKPVDDNAPIVLRIANVSADGDNSHLRTSLHRLAGPAISTSAIRSAASTASRWPAWRPMPVTIQSILPDDHDGELEDRAVADSPGPGLSADPGRRGACCGPCRSSG